MMGSFAALLMVNSLFGKTPSDAIVMVRIKTRNMNIITRTLLLISLLCSTPLLAQEKIVVKGRVISEEGGEPLPQALILVSNNEGTLANSEGFFSIPITAEAKFLTVSYLGFFQKEIPLIGTNQDLGNIRLQSNPTSLNEILITGTSQSYDADFKGSNFFLDKKTLELSNPLNTEEMLRIVPGVNIVGDMGLSNRPNISIRGSWGRRSKKILLMEDGTPAAPSSAIHSARRLL